MVRAFIAIKPPPDIQQAIQMVRNRFNKYGDAWRWVKPENVHLTLKFFGNIPMEAIDSIAQAMQHAAEGQNAFLLVARSLGCFPTVARPRVLWMGLEDPRNALLPLYERLEIALTRQGFTAESRPFRPHLTLARMQRRMDRGTLQGFLQVFRDQLFGDIHVDHITLFQSQLRREGAVYTIMRSVTLER